MAASTFLSQDMKMYLRAWRKTLVGGLLSCGSLWLALACISYDSYDPSFNTAIDGSVHNTCGIWGAYLADVVIQLFGISGHVLWMISFGWGAMLLAGRQLSCGDLSFWLVLFGALGFFYKTIFIWYFRSDDS